MAPQKIGTPASSLVVSLSLLLLIAASSPLSAVWPLLLFGIALFSLLRPPRLVSRGFRTAVSPMALVSLCGFFFWATPGYGQAPATFATGWPGTSLSDGTLRVALPITNTGTLEAMDVLVTSISIPGATLSSPKLPLSLGTIAVGGRAIVYAALEDPNFAPKGTYVITVKGTYIVNAVTFGFSVNRSLTLQPASPDSNTARTGVVTVHSVRGAPFPHQPRESEAEVNTQQWFVPKGPSHPLASVPGHTLRTQAPQPGVDPAVTFKLNNSLNFTSGGFNGEVAEPGAAEPSGATNGAGIVFATANWVGGYSTNGGSSFTQLDPTTIFPKDAVGYCCDQIVEYAKSINMFIWLLQGNGYRLAVATPAMVKSSGGTFWYYWNFPPSFFGESGFDYPDLSIGPNDLYLSWDAGLGCKCSNWGHQVARISLKQIQALGSLNVSWTQPPDGQDAWGAKLVQDTNGTIYWAGQDNTSNMRVFSWADSSGSYFWQEVGVYSWSNSSVVSLTPDGQNWVNYLEGPSPAAFFPGNAVIGGTVSGGNLWLAWDAGKDGNFPQGHVEMVNLDLKANYSLVQQVQIWNSEFAVAYPQLATNACTGEIGFSLEDGGGGSYENHAVGFWGDFLLYTTTDSTIGSKRFGDYVSVRQDPTADLHGAFMDALGYGNEKGVPGEAETADVHYMVFGRADACGASGRNLTPSLKNGTPAVAPATGAAAPHNPAQKP